MNTQPFSQTSDFAPVLSKEFLDIQATIECGFTLKRVHDMIRTCNQLYMYCLVYSYTILILYFYTTILYYTLIKNIHDPTSYFTLALFPPYYLHDGELFKISCTLVFLDSTRSEVCHV